MTNSYNQYNNQYFDQGNPYHQNGKLATAKFGQDTLGHIKEEDYRGNNSQLNKVMRNIKGNYTGHTMRMSKQSHATAATAAFTKFGAGKKKRGKKTLTERSETNHLKLPKLDSAYLRHPGEGT